MRFEILELGLGFGLQALLVFVGFAQQALLARLVAGFGRVGLLGCPRVPCGASPADRFQANAVDWAHRDAQLTARAPRLDDGMHAFVGPDDGVGGAGVQTERAADAPLFVNDGHGHGAIHSMLGAQREDRLAGELGQAADAFITAWWALVDGRIAQSHGLGVSAAIGIATTRALGLWQGRVDAVDQRHHRHRVDRFRRRDDGSFSWEPPWL